MLSIASKHFAVAAVKQRAVTATTVRLLSLKDKYNSKEKVEEDRFIREQEKKFFEKKKKELSEKEHEEELEIFGETVAPAMAEAHAILDKTGDKISDAGLELLARWKLDMKK